MNTCNIQQLLRRGLQSYNFQTSYNLVATEILGVAGPSRYLLNLARTAKDFISISVRTARGAWVHQPDIFHHAGAYRLEIINAASKMALILSNRVISALRRQVWLGEINIHSFHGHLNAL